MCILVDWCAGWNGGGDTCMDAWMGAIDGCDESMALLMIGLDWTGHDWTG